MSASECEGGGQPSGTAFGRVLRVVDNSVRDKRDADEASGTLESLQGDPNGQNCGIGATVLERVSLEEDSRTAICSSCEAEYAVCTSNLSQYSHNQSNPDRCPVSSEIPSSVSSEDERLVSSVSADRGRVDWPGRTVGPYSSASTPRPAAWRASARAEGMTEDKRATQPATSTRSSRLTADEGQTDRRATCRAPARARRGPDAVAGASEGRHRAGVVASLEGRQEGARSGRMGDVSAKTYSGALSG